MLFRNQSTWQPGSWLVLGWPSDRILEQADNESELAFGLLLETNSEVCEKGQAKLTSI